MTSLWPSRLTLLAIWLASALYVWPFVERGWIPHDEGTIAQSTARLQNGEIPHRDFDEAYTGGLSYLHAVGFRVFGTNLRALRLTLFVFFLAFVPVAYAIARRAASPPIAALVTAGCVAWTVPNYFASMPSWYNLFFAVFGAWAVIRYVETDRRIWLWIAGFFAGLSVLVKIVGLYDVAAIFLFLVYREQLLSTGLRIRPRSTGFFVLKAAGGVLLGAVIYRIFARPSDTMDFVCFVLPAWILIAFVLESEWKQGAGSLKERLAGLAQLSWPFLLGVALPVGAFGALYAANGALSALWTGVFVLPLQRISAAAFPLPSVWWLVAVVPYCAILLSSRIRRIRNGRLEVTAVVLLLGALLYSGSSRTSYEWIWNSARFLNVVAVIVGCFRLRKIGDARIDSPRREHLFLFLALAAFLSLVQFPFAAPIYVCYAAPATLFALLYLVSDKEERSGWLQVSALAFYTAFAVLFMNPGYVFYLGGAPMRYEAKGDLSIDRGKLRVPDGEARAYNQIVAEVTEKVQKGELMYAGPDSPELYFLCARQNPTRILFETLSGVDPKHDTKLLRNLFSRPEMKMIVWNRSPEFTHGLWRVYREQLWARFPHSKEVGKYTLMWRD